MAAEMTAASAAGAGMANGSHVTVGAEAPAMARSNIAAVLHGPRDMRIETRACPAPGPDEVTIRVRATGLCGSDLHYYVHGRNGDFALQHPMCLGHESVGDVVAVGANVGASCPHLVVGSRAAVEPGRNCTACDYCLGGRYNLCPTLRFASSAKTAPHLDGTLQRFFNWPARLVHVLPSSMPLYSAGLIEPLAVVLQALSRSRLEPGQSVLVVGAGAVGLLACAAAKAFGASFVAAVDIDADRLRFARRTGWADATFCTKPAGANGSGGGTGAAAASTSAAGLPPAEPSRQEQDKMAMGVAKAQAADIITAVSSTSATADMAVRGAGGFDVVYECTGVPACVHTSVFAARTGGRVALIGMGHPVMTMPLGAAALREVDILGVFRYANMFPKAIRLLSSGALPSHGARGGGGVAGKDDGPINGHRNDDSQHASSTAATSRATGTGTAGMGGIVSLVSHAYPLERAVEAFETLRVGQSPDGKRVVKVFVVDEGADSDAV